MNRKFLLLYTILPHIEICYDYYNLEQSKSYNNTMERSKQLENTMSKLLRCLLILDVFAGLLANNARIVFSCSYSRIAGLDGQLRPGILNK